MLASRGIQVPIVGNVYLLSRGRRPAVQQRQAGRLRGQRRVAQRGGEIFRPERTRGRSSSRSWPPSNWPCSRGWASPPATWAASPSRRPSARSSTWPRATAADDWREFIREIQFSQPDEFFLFEHDRMTGLSEPTRINPAYRRSLAEPPASKEVTLSYRVSRLVHGWRLRATRGLYGLLRRLFGRWDKKPGLLGRLAYGWSGVEAAAVRLPGMRRLQPAGLRVSLPPSRLLEERPQRALRRLGQGPLRIGRQGVFLGPRLRAVEGLRRIGAHARSAGGDLQYRS